MDPNRRTSLRLLTSAALLPASLPLAADPGEALPREIVIIAATSAGSGPDLVVRAIAAHAERHHGIRATVQNLPQVQGEIALAQCLVRPADGRTWFMAPDSVLVVNPHLFPRPQPLDPLHGLLPVAQTGSNLFLLMVKADDPIRSVEDWIREARAAEGKPMHYGSGGVGTMHHLLMADLSHRLGLHMNHVAYRGGGEASLGLARGEVRICLAGASAMPLVKSGRLRTLAVAAAGPSARYPGVPSLGEVAPGFDGTVWYGWFARSGLPARLVDAMGALLQQSLADPDVLQALELKSDIQPTYAAGAALGSLVRQDFLRFGAVVSRIPGLKS